MKLFYDNGLMSMNTITFCTVHQIKRKNIYNYVDDNGTNIFVKYYGEICSTQWVIAIYNKIIRCAVNFVSNMIGTTFKL